MTKDRRYVLVKQDARLIKLFDRRKNQMYRIEGPDAYKVPGSLDSHLRFHPLATLHASTALPAQIETIEK